MNRRNLKKNKSGKESSEKAHLWKGRIFKKANSEQEKVKKNKTEKEKSEKGHFWKGGYEEDYKNIKGQF